MGISALVVMAISPYAAAEGVPITIDATRVGAPISKYIYGQFIEHLGHCIYGGIWAEMLEDRKFFFAVGDKESPWKPLGDAVIDMDTAQPYVGAHTPALPAGTGFVQDGLGVVAGHEYAGRIVLAGAGSVSVSLVWGPGKEDRQTTLIDGLTSAFQKRPLRFSAKATTDAARLEIRGTAPFRVGTVSLMPSDNIEGMRADTVALLKELDAPIYRWPGGNFVSGYDWRDGLGDPDLRPPRKNPAWTGVEHNDFGMHEFLRFCELIGTEPYIVVNSGQGDMQLARDEVEYVNGAADTPQGQLRARNGHTEPWRVVWWGVGNEMYGNWQLGHMPLEEYVKKHNQLADAMRAVDPKIKLVGVGDTGPWSEAMLAQCSGHMDLLSEHFYCKDKPDVAEHVDQIPHNVRWKAESHRRFLNEIPAVKGKDIRIALDEWNYWYGPDVYGEIGVQYHLKDALGIAAGLHEMFRFSDTFFMANYAQTVNVIGCIKTNKTAACFDTTGLVLTLYRRHFGVDPVAVSGAPKPLDVAAAWTADHKALTVGIVNPTAEAVTPPIQISGAKLAAEGRVWRITGPDPLAVNIPGKAPDVTVGEEKASDFRVPPYSVCLFVRPAL